jgi:transcriptional regulator with XRE-family HTH domain
MSALEAAMRTGISGSRLGYIERSEAAGSLRMSTLARVAAALHSQLLYVVLPEAPLEDLVLRQAYHKALEELSIPSSVASDGSTLDPETEEYLEVRTLDLVDRRGLWHNAQGAGTVPGAGLGLGLGRSPR